MATLKFKVLTGILIFLILVTSSQQASIAKNYTVEILRQSKAAEILSFLQKNDNPCDNFYRNVCGNWKRTYPATYAKPKTSYFGQIHNLYIQKCRELLIKYKGTNELYEMLKNFHESCLNTENIKTNETLINILDFRGGWPIITAPNWYEREYDWLKFVADIRKNLGLNIFIGLEIIPDLEGREMQRIKIGAPKLPLGSKLKYLDNNYENERTEYKQKIAEKLQKHFIGMSMEWSEEVAQQVLDIEINLAKGLSNNQTLTLKQGVKEQTIAQLKANYARFVDLNRYLTIIFDRTITEQVYEYSENYFNNLLNVIEKTPKLQIANYTIWRVLDKLVFLTDKIDTNHNIWCTKQVIKYFPKYMEDLYDQQYDALNNGLKMNEIFDKLKNTFKAKLENPTTLNWMSEETREKAREKLDRLELSILTHYSLTLKTEANEIIYKIKNDNYYENLFYIMQWKTRNELNKLNSGKITAEMSSTTYNMLPYYKYTKNEIAVPIEFVQPNFFWDRAYPVSLQYGTLGVLLAQQMLRGFFEEGTLYDEHGDLNKWWDNDTENAFKLHENCFARQYANYKFQGKIVVDKHAILKAILDAASINLAYEAYTNLWPNATMDPHFEEKLPGVHFTSTQIFYVGFGQMYCADYYLHSTETINELPERLRCNGAIVNSEKFADEFKCPIDSKMNPKNKCKVF